MRANTPSELTSFFGVFESELTYFRFPSENPKVGVEVST
jgi:hypothetical protein